MADSREKRHVKSMVFPSQSARRGRGEELDPLRRPEQEALEEALGEVLVSAALGDGGPATWISAIRGGGGGSG